jgi:hypothetical protein
MGINKHLIATKIFKFSIWKFKRGSLSDKCRTVNSNTSWTGMAKDIVLNNVTKSNLTPCLYFLSILTTKIPTGKSKVSEGNGKWTYPF